MSLEEHLRDADAQASLDASYLTLMASSGVLAAVALLTNSVPILIGSMVIAPALSPLELVSLAAVNRRGDLVARGVLIAGVGLSVAVAGAVATTWALNATNVVPLETNLLTKPLLEERVRPGWSSAVAAGAAGVAGSLATVQHRTDTLVGVVAALALVPAAAAAGIALLSGSPTRAWGGILLLGTNVVLIVLTGVATLSVIQWTGRRT